MDLLPDLFWVLRSVGRSFVNSVFVERRCTRKKSPLLPGDASTDRHKRKSEGSSLLCRSSRFGYDMPRRSAAVQTSSLRCLGLREHEARAARPFCKLSAQPESGRYSRRLLSGTPILFSAKLTKPGPAFCALPQGVRRNWEGDSFGKGISAVLSPSRVVSGNATIRRQNLDIKGLRTTHLWHWSALFMSFRVDLIP